jgi:hypothetical protein
MSEAKQLPEDFLKSLGVSEERWSGKPRLRIPYADRDGVVQAIRYRMSLDGGSRFEWRKGDDPCLYGLANLDEYYKHGDVILVEGETDCWTLWFHHIRALGIPGKTSWQHHWADYFKRPSFGVYLWLESDAYALAEKVGADIPHLRIITPPPGIKDPSEFYLSLRKAPS